MPAFRTLRLPTASDIRFIPDNSKDKRPFDLPIPKCDKCGQPMLLDEEEQRWYCFRDKVVLIGNETTIKPGQKRRRNWGRILMAALFCAIPFSNPSFFLSLYDQLRSRKLICPRCKSSANEVANRTLRLKNKRFDTVLEFRCLDCGAVWQRWGERGLKVQEN